MGHIFVAILLETANSFVFLSKTVCSVCNNKFPGMLTIEIFEFWNFDKTCEQIRANPVRMIFLTNFFKGLIKVLLCAVACSKVEVILIGS